MEPRLSSLCSLVGKGLFLLCPLSLCLGFYIPKELCHTQSTWSYNCLCAALVYINP